MTGMREWSATAGSNTSVGGVSIAEGMARASVNNAMRAIMADGANFLLDIGGAKATTGSSNTYAITLDSAPTAYANNLYFLATANHSNTGAATMDVNSIGAKDIEKIVAGSATALASGDFPSGHIGVFTYSSGNNSVILMNPANPLMGTGTITSAQLAAAITDETGTGAAVFGTGPTITLANGTGLPISTGVSGLGTGVATFLATPSSANLASAVTDETGSGALVFGTSPTLTTPTISGALTIAGQIAFPASQSASADANTLDDYEEGTWTPVLTFATPGDLSVTYSTQVGTYTKIGRLVLLNWNIVTSAFTHTTASGAMNITGLPFTSATITSNTMVGTMGWTGITKANYTQWVPRIGSAGTVITALGSGSSVSTATLSTGDMPTGGSVVLNGTIAYYAA